MVVKDVVMLRRDEFDQMFGSQADVEFIPLPGDLPAPLLYHDQQWGNANEMGPQWCVTESSTTGLYIFEVDAMRDAPVDLRYSEYVYDLEPLLINTYTGQIIED